MALADSFHLPFTAPGRNFSFNGPTQHIMQPKPMRIVLFAVGVALIAAAIFEVARDLVIVSRSNAATVTLMSGPQPFYMFFGGAILCVVSFFIGRKRN
jgi:hypothetical protein